MPKAKSSANNESTAITEQKSDFLALSSTDFAEMVSEELDGLDVGFERVKIPSGGATMYEMPTDDGDETESVKVYSAVILHQHALNAFYSNKYTGGSNPPDCASIDGKTGVGDPGGDCATCHLNQYGSGENGAKACKNRRRLYMLRPGELFPLLLSLPTGSLKAFAKYIKQQLSKGRRLNAVVTRFGLKKVTNAGGIAYSQATFALDRVLTPEEHAQILKLSEQIKAYSARVGFEAEGAGIADEDIPFDSDEEEGEAARQYL